MEEEKSKISVGVEGDFEEEQDMLEFINELELDALNTAKSFIKRTKKGQPPTDEELAAQKQLNNQIKIITQLYNQQQKRNKAESKPEGIGGGFMGDVRSAKSSIGEIVGKIKNEE